MKTQTQQLAEVGLQAISIHTPEGLVPAACKRKSDLTVKPQKYPRLELETRPVVDTATAAHWLLRQQQTMRAWASSEREPLRPIRINGRLAWSVAEIKRLLGGRE